MGGEFCLAPITGVNSDAVQGIVERRPEIVNGIPEDEGYAFWNGLSLGDVKRIASSFRIVLDEDFMRVEWSDCLDGPVKISNVMCGPINL
jgi:hypothetical protein